MDPIENYQWGQDPIETDLALHQRPEADRKAFEIYPPKKRSYLSLSKVRACSPKRVFDKKTLMRGVNCQMEPKARAGQEGPLPRGGSF